MCIIAISDYNVQNLTKEVLETCFYNNDDGAGFASWNRQTQLWDVEKGFLKFEDFWEAFSAHNFGEEDYVICHFRIGSSGNKDAGNTHPFPIVDNYDEMRELKFSVPNILFHNGVIGSGEGIYSDTMKHTKNMIAPLLPHFEERGIKDIAIEVSRDVSNKWVVTRGSKIYQWGKFEKSKEGWEFSNTSYSYRKAIIYNSNHYGAGWGSGYTLGGNQWDKYYDKNGEFDAKKWRKDIAKKQNIKLPEEKDKVNLVDGVIDSKPDNDTSFIYGLMNEEGEVIWDKLESEEKVKPEYLFCPECGNDSGLMDNPYQGEGDTLCNNCGAVFDDTSGRVHYFDKDYHDAYTKRRTNRTSG